MNPSLGKVSGFHARLKSGLKERPNRDIIIGQMALVMIGFIGHYKVEE